MIDIAKLYVKNSTIQSIYVTTNASLPDRIENFIKRFQKQTTQLNNLFKFQLMIYGKHNKVRKIKNLFDNIILIGL